MGLGLHGEGGIGGARNFGDGEEPTFPFCRALDVEEDFKWAGTDFEVVILSDAEESRRGALAGLSVGLNGEGFPLFRDKVPSAVLAVCGDIRDDGLGGVVDRGGNRWREDGL